MKFLQRTLIQHVGNLYLLNTWKTGIYNYKRRVKTLLLFFLGKNDKKYRNYCRKEKL